MASHLQSHQESFMNHLKLMKEDDIHTDVTLTLSDESSIKCHRLVLMASSRFFRAMFQPGSKEVAKKDVKLDFGDADSIRTLVDAFYTGEIHATQENVKALVIACDFLSCDHLKAYCEEYLAAHLTSSNYIDLYNFGKLYNLQKVLSSAFGLILENFQEFTKTPDFGQLSEDDLLEILTDDGLNAENEDVVFEAVLRWVHLDLDLRQRLFPKLAPHIRFPFCTTANLTHSICNDRLVLDSGCIGLAVEALKSQHHCNRHCVLHNARFMPRRTFSGKKQRLIRVIESSSCSEVSFEYTDRIDGTVEWTAIEPKVASTLNQTFASPTGIYAVTDQQCHLLVAECSYVTAIPWAPLANQGALAFLDGRIFAFGGCSDQTIATQSVKSLQRTVPTPQWKSEEEMLLPVCHHCVALFANKVFVFGGRTEEGLSVVTQEFDVIKGNWRRRGDMPGHCVGGKAVVLNEKIYVIGGEERVCYRYDPANDQWEVLSKPTVHCFYTTTSTWYGKILHGTEELIELFDPETGLWSHQKQLNRSDAYRMQLHTLCF